METDTDPGRLSLSYNKDVPTLVPTRPESEIAAELLKRLHDALSAHVLPLMDEAQRHGLRVAWDGIGPAPPAFQHHRVNGLRLEKWYTP